MKIKMLATACGAKGNFQAGKIYEIEDEQGKQIVKGGYGIDIGEQEKKEAERIAKIKEEKNKQKIVEKIQEEQQISPKVKTTVNKKAMKVADSAHSDEK